MQSVLDRYQPGETEVLASLTVAELTATLKKRGQVPPKARKAELVSLLAATLASSTEEAGDNGAPGDGPVVAAASDAAPEMPVKATASGVPQPPVADEAAASTELSPSTGRKRKKTGGSPLAEPVTAPAAATSATSTHSGSSADAAADCVTASPAASVPQVKRRLAGFSKSFERAIGQVSVPRSEPQGRWVGAVRVFAVPPPTLL